MPTAVSYPGGSALTATASVLRTVGARSAGRMGVATCAESVTTSAKSALGGPACACLTVLAKSAETTVAGDHVVGVQTRRTPA